MKLNTGLMALMMVAASPLEAQQASLVPEIGAPDLTVFGRPDPNVRKATALVNGDVLTDTDVDQRLSLVIAANGGRVGAEERERLRAQILRNLIDEKLQIQEARAKEITVDEGDVDGTFGRVAKNFKKSPEEFETYLRDQGASPATLRQQIRAELAWNRLMRRKVEPFVNVGDDEVNGVIAKLEAAKGKDEYRVGEIFLSAPPENDAQARATADNIIAQIKRGASFVAYARQFSESASAAVGGDLGWVRAEQLPEAVRPVVGGMTVGGISEPIRVAGGLTVVALIDKRQVLAADPNDAVLNLKQLAFDFRGGTTETEAAASIKKLKEATVGLGGCGNVEKAAKAIGAEASSNDALKLKEMPPQLQSLVKSMRVGESTPPFGSRAEGVRVLVLCGRDDVGAPKPPSFDEVYAQLNDERIGRASRRYIRDLRRDAIVDYR